MKMRGSSLRFTITFQVTWSAAAVRTRRKASPLSLNVRSYNN